MKPENHPNSIGFFPSLISVVIFLLILGGMFFGFTRFYPQLAQNTLERFQREPSNGSNGNETVQTPAEETLAPFVRGILSGVRTAELSTVRPPSEPLKVTSITGYQSGIKTAVLASKNWYNLDRQLFRVRGLEFGMKVAEASSKTRINRGSQEYQLRLINQLESALSTNIEELLSVNLDNRREVLEDYVEGLQELEDESRIEVENLQRIIAEARAEIELQQNTAEQFSPDVEGGGSSDQNVGAFLEARRAIDEATITGRRASDLLNRLGPLNQRLQQVIAAIQANFDALAAGIKITPTPGVNLPLIQE